MREYVENDWVQTFEVKIHGTHLEVRIMEVVTPIGKPLLLFDLWLDKVQCTAYSTSLS